ncbi:MAG: hypothetical protein ACT4OS_01750 [Acidimicrobiales bacterium]
MKTSERFPELAMADTFQWLLEEATSFLADPDADEDPVGARARALLTLAHASRQARELVAERLEAGELLAAEIHIESRCGETDVSAHRHLPNPLALLLICSQRARAGDRVAVVVRRSAMAATERSSHWPFGLEVAERLTRPGPAAPC